MLAGGRSSEHEISLASARSVTEALDPERYEAVMIEIGRDGRWVLPAAGTRSGALESSAATLPVPTTAASPVALAEVDVVVPILHGPFGEDGTVQGLLELAGVPYVGAGVAASALCMDKDLCKAVLRDRGIPVARNETLRAGDAIANPFGYPVFVKPARLGSSVGISKVPVGRRAGGSGRAGPPARRQGARGGVRARPGGGVQRARQPRARRLPAVGEIVANADWYDFGAKYDEGGMELIVPARLAPEVTARVQQLAVESFIATDCEGMARVDFFVRPGR